jgi:hypothetical protein
MCHLVLGMIAAFAILCPPISQTPGNPENSPSILIALPPAIPSDNVAIRYFMTGPFGGYGGFVEARTSVHSYEIIASADNQPATSMKIIVYAAGCKFQTFQFDLSQVRQVNTRFVCETLPKIALSGKIESKLPLTRDTELTVQYMASWGNEFFGIADGMVPEFMVATATPESDGTFQMEVPDFSADQTAASFKRCASLHLGLRDRKTWNWIALNLEPEQPEFRSAGRSLRVSPNYPPGLKFVVGYQ